MRKGHTATQHQEETRGQIGQDTDAATEGLPKPQGVQPLPQACLDADGQSAVPERRILGGRRHILVHHPLLRPRTRRCGRSPHLASPLLCRARVVLRRRRRHSAHGTRHYALTPRHRARPHDGRLLYPSGQTRRGAAPPAACGQKGEEQGP